MQWSARGTGREQEQRRDKNKCGVSDPEWNGHQAGAGMRRMDAAGRRRKRRCMTPNAMAPSPAT
jgi:hypothetical protein